MFRAFRENSNNCIFIQNLVAGSVYDHFVMQYHSFCKYYSIYNKWQINITVIEEMNFYEVIHSKYSSNT